jgi:CBS domain-containing protein
MRVSCPGGEAARMAVDIEHIRVRDAMHAGILGCPAGASLGEVARIMATHRVHAVAVMDERGAPRGGVISDLDVVGAVSSGASPTAAEVAATQPIAVSSDDRLAHAATLMAEHGISHLVVADATDGHPIGVLSTLDIVSVLAAATTDG